MYLPPLLPPRETASWPNRRALLRQRIAAANADVVCLQEVAPESFADDFAFMAELGYDGVELFRKGRFRPATFWKSARCRLAAPAAHKDRVLLTSFWVGDSGTAQAKPWHVLNCHLQAGKEGPRRLRQIQEGAKAAFTAAKSLKEKQPASTIRLLVCGDFNGDDSSAAVRFLEGSTITPEFLEDGRPVCSSEKRLLLTSPLLDAAAQPDRPPPPTLVVPELISVLLRPGTEDEAEIAEEVEEKLAEIFRERANEAGGMNAEAVREWLVAINGRPDRGSEFRAAARAMGGGPDSGVEGLPEAGTLSLDAFLGVYRAELRQGKFWGVAHDLAVLGRGVAPRGVFSARFDRVYASAAVETVAVVDAVSEVACPNEVEPSDHLPVAAAFVAR